MDNKNPKKELARDLLALGSWIFYLLVIVRALIKPYRPLTDQLIIAAITLILLSLLIKNSDTYLAKAIILAFFTSIFYNDNLFSLFAAIVIIGMLISSHYLENSKTKIAKGIIIGIIATLLGYYLSTPSINLF